MIFCETCYIEVEYTTNRVLKYVAVKGIEGNYRGKEARCVECRNVIFVPTIHDYNLEQINKMYFK